MSRCFGFPPPGYELKAGTGILDFITKEKYREKKHKKERREHKEKRDKDGSKGKPKKKKDQNHKDRKKEKDSTKRRKSENIKAESQAKEHWQETNEANDSKLKEESNNRIRNDGAENLMFGNFRNSIQRKFQGVDAASEMENKKYGERSLASDSVAAPNKPEMQKLGAKFSASNSFDSARRRKYVFGISVENVSIKAKTEMFQVPQSVEKDILKKIERKNKIQGKEAEDSRLQHKTIHSMNKSVAEHNKPNNFKKKDQVKTLNSKPLAAAHKGAAIGSAYSDNESTKKRKLLAANGFLQENERPGKIPRMNSSSSQSAVTGALNKPRVPKMAKLPEIDDQEWLFNGHDCLQKSKAELRTEKIPMVFAEAIWIGSGDVLALPYVVPL